MQSILYDVEQSAAQRAPGPIAPFQQELAGRHLRLRDDNKIHVEIVGPEGAPALDLQAIGRFGGDVDDHGLVPGDGRFANRTDAWVPVNQLTALARALPEGYFMERAAAFTPDAVGGEGAISINSDSYRDGGANGSGLTIAVIDGGYRNLTLARNVGDAPTLGNTTFVNLAASPFEDSDDSRHGTGCVEATFDHCPGAQYVLYKINSTADTGTAVTDAINKGVNVITHSLSRYNLGWADNTGAACTAANNAADNGMLFFTSAGNRAQQHWQGNFNSGPDADGWHDWVAGGDERNTLAINDDGGGNFYLSWDTSGGTYNYDLYLYDGNTVLASSTNGGNTFESFGYTNTTGSTITASIAVFRSSGGTSEMEVFFHESGGSGNFERQVATGSTTSPSNTSDSRVISNAAVTVSQHDSLGGTSGIVASYSSRGPSNGGLILPDLSGPTNTNTTAYGRTFGGTSCATPNNAGAACAFWSARTGYNNSAMQWLLFEQADMFKDWGNNGNDNTYGFGGTQFVDFSSNTIWLVRGYNNVAEATTGPNYTFQAAYDQAASSGRILIFPGGSYPETANMLGTKFLNVETVENNANLGF